VAGETSGDLLAGLLLDGMRERWPELRAHGIGGAQMQRRGFDVWWPYEKLAVRGYVEVLRHYREIVGIRRQVRERLLREKPTAFVGIDAPDFNLDLEASLRESGVRTVHFVCPSIWAWRAERVHKIRRSCDHVLCVFPFEPPLLQGHGIAATYVGHPLANVIPTVPDRAAARAALGLPHEETVVAILPGSRRAEIEHLAARFMRAAALVTNERPRVRFVVPALPQFRARLQHEAQAAGVAHCTTIVDGRSHAVLAACDLALVASGTATLEAALFKRPMVISYHMNWLSWEIHERKRLQPWVGLPNILAGDFVVPELLQERCKPDLLARALLEWLDAPARMAAITEKFTAMHVELQRDTARLATDAIQEVIAHS